MAGSRKLGRTSDHRKAMLRAMVTFLLENGKIETTVTRAKEVRAMAEKMITLGKAGDLHSKRQVFAYVTKEDVCKKLFNEIAPKYADRNGGYTKIVKIGPRRGDAAMQNSQSKTAMNNMKYEVARELGVNLVEGYNGHLSSKDAGQVGGEMVRKMIAEYQRQHSN